MPPITDVVKNLMIINVIVFICTDLLFPQFNIKEYFTLYPFGTEWHHPYQLVTSIFGHSSLTHILFNMMGLFFFGPIVESTLGPKRFLFLYLSAGLAGSILSAYLIPGRVIGASGAINGVLVAMALMYPNVKMIIFPIPFEIRAIVLVGAYLFYDLIAGVGSMNTGVAHFAHLGGGIMGGILIYKWGLINFKF
jgi:membrane associated rhomboid family serine protease